MTHTMVVSDVGSNPYNAIGFSLSISSVILFFYSNARMKILHLVTVEMTALGDK